jgi:hypothetical protein
VVWFGRFTYYRRGEREQQENKVRAAGGGNRSYSTVQNSDRREDGREGAMPSQRERAVKDKTEQSGFFNKGRERREEGEREK